jgi:hypothetical protein
VSRYRSRGNVDFKLGYYLQTTVIDQVRRVRRCEKGRLKWGRVSTFNIWSPLKHRTSGCCSVVKCQMFRRDPSHIARTGDSAIGERFGRPGQTLGCSWQTSVAPDKPSDARNKISDAPNEPLVAPDKPWDVPNKPSVAPDKPSDVPDNPLDAPKNLRKRRPKVWKSRINLRKRRQNLRNIPSRARNNGKSALVDCLHETSLKTHKGIGTIS